MGGVFGGLVGFVRWGFFWALMMELSHIEVFVWDEGVWVRRVAECCGEVDGRCYICVIVQVVVGVDCEGAVVVWVLFRCWSCVGGTADCKISVCGVCNGSFVLILG